jgi:membrane protease YdiL (CAAX protease family)
MTDLPPIAPVASTLQRPTRESQWTLFAVLGVLCLFASIAIYAIGWRAWPQWVAGERIKYLGWIGIGAVICIGLMVIAFASPWIGTVKASGLGANLEVDGHG